MRIIGGIYRHRLIEYPLDNKTRPTKDRIREAIFNALGDITNTNVLDLYAGSGSMGLEALSRGALKATFVDISLDAINCIKNNVKTLNISGNSVSIYHQSDLEVLEKIKENHEQFDIVFLDPPYQEGDYLSIIKKIYEEGILKDNGIIVVEVNYPLSFQHSFNKIKEYKYGEILVYILWR